MSAQEEAAVIDYLMETRELDREATANLLHIGLGNGWFANAEPELRALVVAYKNTMGKSP